MSVGKTVGILADKMLKLTGKAVKKLEDYGAKSAEENNNDNARKLAETMNKLGKKLEERHDEYIARVEENADELAEKGKDALDKLKKVYQEMKTRADAAKEKAEIDARRDVAPESAETEDKAAEKKFLTNSRQSGNNHDLKQQLCKIRGSFTHSQIRRFSHKNAQDLHKNPI